MSICAFPVTLPKQIFRFFTSSLSSFTTLCNFTLALLPFTVGTKPKLITPLKDVKVTAPKATSLTCGISAGEPAPRIHWYKDGKEIYPSRKYDAEYEDSTATLTINETDASDSASYTCMADNGVGRVETEATLTVNGEYTAYCTIYEELKIGFFAFLVV